MLSIIVIVLGVLGTWFWFGVHQRHIVETQAGILSLATMKWNECFKLTLKVLHSEGYTDASASEQPSNDGTEFLLLHDGARVLLRYKDGTAYRITPAVVLDFAKYIKRYGANNGILVTIGSIESPARDVARHNGIHLIDGVLLWPKIRDYLPSSIVEQVLKQAKDETKKWLWVGGIGSILLGILIFFITWSPTEDAVGTPEKLVVSAPHSAASTSTVDPALTQMKATAEAMAKAIQLTDAQRLQRRDEVVKTLASIVQIDSAVWSSESTLQLKFKQSDGEDKTLINEVCRILVQYEELRYTRLQLESPAGSNTPVRWKQCR